MDTPYFLWDYNITQDKVRAILRGNNETERLWLTGRILTHARFEDVWQYLNISDIVLAFPKLRLKPTIASAWRHALIVWGYSV